MQKSVWWSGARPDGDQALGVNKITTAVEPGHRVNS